MQWLPNKHKVVIWSKADPANYMFGSVVSYSGTSLEVDVVETRGAGEHSDWIIAAAGYYSLSSLRGFIYPAWEAVAARYNKPISCYEGGCEAITPSRENCRAMSIDELYGDTYRGRELISYGKIGRLVAAYKRSKNFEDLVTEQFNQFMRFAHSKEPCWFNLVGNYPWSLFPPAVGSSGDLYSVPFKSFDAFANYNHR